MQTDEVNAPRIGDGGEWSFLGGVWADGPDGELSPPESGGEPNFAVLHGREYSDVDMRCRFKFRWGHGGARLLFRVQDSMRYYALDIPWCGQQNRNRHFWAGIVLADGTPLQRYLNLGLVTGICPEHERWYQARVQCVGSRIRAWIDGRPVADIEDRTLAAGRMGLMGEATAGHGTPVFADVQVAGQEVGPSPWQGLAAPPKHWITPCPEVDPETYQGYPSMVKSNSGALMVSLPFHDPNGGPPPRRVVWVRSSDGGRTWSEPEEPTLPAGLGGVFVKQDGTWACVHRDVPGMGLEGMVMFESRDEGKTWSDAGPLKIVGELLERFLEHPPPPRCVLNVNIPNPGEAGIRGLRPTSLGMRYYSKEVVERQDPRGRGYVWIGGAEITTEDIEGSDCNALREGYVSITPVSFDLTHPTALAGMERWHHDSNPGSDDA